MFPPLYSRLFLSAHCVEAVVFLHTVAPVAVFIPTGRSVENVLLFLVSFIVWHLLSSASSMSHLHLLKSPSSSPSSVTLCYFPPSNKVNCHVSAQSTWEQREAFGGLFDSALSLSLIFLTNHRHTHFFPCLPSLILQIIRAKPVIHWYFPKEEDRRRCRFPPRVSLISTCIVF